MTLDNRTPSLSVSGIESNVCIFLFYSEGRPRQRTFLFCTAWELAVPIPCTTVFLALLRSDNRYSPPPSSRIEAEQFHQGLHKAMLGFGVAENGTCNTMLVM